MEEVKNKFMTDTQDQILKELVERYFEGGNATATTGSLLKIFWMQYGILLKKILNNLIKQRWISSFVF